MANTKIEWAEKVWNPVVGCTKISPGCQNCYAERMAARLENIAYKTGNQKLHDKYYPTINCNGTWTGKVSLCPDALDEPLCWKKPRRVFVCSMGDLFHEDVPHEFIDYVFAVMGRSQQHTFILLTKRPERMREYLQAGRYQQILNIAYRLKFRPEGLGKGIDNPKDMRWWPNVWLGVTAENQQQADKRIPILLQIPAAVRFVSVEPMLGPVDLTRIDIGGNVWINSLTGDCKSYHPYGGMWKTSESKNKLDWVICGGETGPGARPMHPDWVRSLLDQAKKAGVPFFFKQWGTWKPVEKVKHGLLYDDEHRLSSHMVIDLKGEDWTGAGGYGFIKPGWHFERVGKKVAGRILDGQIWDEMPEVTP